MVDWGQGSCNYRRLVAISASWKHNLTFGLISGVNFRSPLQYSKNPICTNAFHPGSLWVISRCISTESIKIAPKVSYYNK